MVGIDLLIPRRPEGHCTRQVVEEVVGVAGKVEHVSPLRNSMVVAVVAPIWQLRAWPRHVDRAKQVF